MSCYEWESGTITIPSKEWAKFRTGLLKVWNERELARLETAKAAHKKLTEACKGKRGSKRVAALKAAVEARFTRLKRDYGGGYRVERDPEIRDMIVTREGADWDNSETYTLKPLPKKKDLKLFATSKDAALHLGDGYVAFKNSNRTVVWNVDENNHARDTAHDHWFARELFTALRRMTWTRGSGGDIIGNDEYNSGEDEGDGGNYVTMTFGPKTPTPLRGCYSN